MTADPKRWTSENPDAATPDAERQRRWLDGNADAFAAQAAWHDREGHPLADIIAGPGGQYWRT